MEDLIQMQVLSEGRLNKPLDFNESAYTMCLIGLEKPFDRVRMKHVIHLYNQAISWI